MLPTRTGDSASPPLSLVRSVARSCSATRSKFYAHPRSTDRVLISFLSIAIFASTPSSAAGTVGAIFNSALQLGSSVGIAAVTSIQTSIDGGEVQAASVPLPTTKAEWTDAYRGRAAAYWFVFAAVVLETLAVLVFFRSHAIPGDEEREEERERKRMKRRWTTRGTRHSNLGFGGFSNAEGCHKTRKEMLRRDRITEIITECLCKCVCVNIA
jgi:hypothetical protein